MYYCSMFLYFIFIDMLPTVFVESQARMQVQAATTNNIHWLPEYPRAIIALTTVIWYI